MKKVVLLCVVALCLTACHCERKPGATCRKAACQCKHGQLQTKCDCHDVWMGPMQKACKCATTCKHKPAPRPMPKPVVKPAPAPVKTAETKAAEQTAALKNLGAVKTEGKKVSLNYKEPIKFGHNSAEIQNTSYSDLDETAKILKNYPDTKVTVKGYSDSLGDPAYNVDLSQRRAQAVADALVQRGVKAENITAVGYGAANPVATNKTVEGRRLNRRVELEVENN